MTTARSWSCAARSKRTRREDACAEDVCSEHTRARPTGIWAALIWAALIVLLVALLQGCVPPVPVPPVPTGPPQESSVPTVQASPSAGPAGHPEVRALLGDPAIRVVELTLDLARRVDFVRYEVPRGPRQSEELARVEDLAVELNEAIASLWEGIRAVDPQLSAIVSAATQLITEAERIEREVLTDVSALRPFVDFDIEMGNVVAVWSQRGSRPEFAARMTDLVGEAATLVEQARRLDPYPAGCVALRVNRIRWGQVVLRRTEELRDSAISGQGTLYDELRDRFGRAPVGEDPVAADSEARTCWARSTTLFGVPEVMTAHLQELDQAL